MLQKKKKKFDYSNNVLKVKNVKIFTFMMEGKQSVCVCVMHMIHDDIETATCVSPYTPSNRFPVKDVVRSKKKGKRH